VLLLSTNRDEIEGEGGLTDAATELANAEVEFSSMVDRADLLVLWEQDAGMCREKGVR